MAHATKSRAGYMREYRAVVKRTRGFHDKKIRKDAAEAMRQAIIAEFRRLGSLELSGYTAAEIVQRLTMFPWN